MIFDVNRQFWYAIICVFVFYLCFYGSVIGVAQESESGQEIVIDTAVDRSDVTVGDPILYTLTIRYLPEIKPSLPGWGVNLGQFEIQDYEVTDPVREGSYFVQESRYKIATYYAEDYTIPPITVSYKDQSGEVREITSEPIEIKVRSVAPSEAKEIRTIKPPQEIPPDYSMYYVLAGAILGLAAIIAGLVWIVKWRTKRKLMAPEPQEPPRPAHELAYEELDALINSTLLAEQRYKEYYFELSEIVRRYLSRRFAIQTLERTSTEILEDLDQINDISDTMHERISGHFAHCDMVKFAKYIPGLEEIQDATDEARQIVDLTREQHESLDNGSGGKDLVVQGTEVSRSS